MDFIAFPENATYGSVHPDIIWDLGFFVGPATSIFTLMGVVFFFFYRIDKARHDEILRQLADRVDVDSAVVDASADTTRQLPGVPSD